MEHIIREENMMAM
ncbi:hypothetical protein QQP08_020617 [Theobroma cacao]|nr:hypothetical protein QQP08_020617 [Theobroma cacao]